MYRTLHKCTARLATRAPQATGAYSDSTDSSSAAICARMTVKLGVATGGTGITLSAYRSRDSKTWSLALSFDQLQAALHSSNSSSSSSGTGDSGSQSAGLATGVHLYQVVGDVRLQHQRSTILHCQSESRLWKHSCDQLTCRVKLRHLLLLVIVQPVICWKGSDRGTDG